MAPRKKKDPPQASSYEHSEASAPMRPEAGVQAQFKHRKPAKSYRYDSSLDPVLSWDENPSREQGEALIARIIAAETLEEAKAAASELKQLSKPFLNWSGKAEQPELTVPSLPLFVHERPRPRAWGCSWVPWTHEQPQLPNRPPAPRPHPAGVDVPDLCGGRFVPHTLGPRCRARFGSRR